MEETTPSSIGVFKMCQGFENPAVAARRRRIEIRRLKDIANAGNLSSEPVSKRSRPIIDSSAVVHGDGDLTSPELDIDVVTRSFRSFPNSDDQEGEVDHFIPESETRMFESPPSSPFLQEDGETLSIDSIIVCYNSEEETVASMDADLLPDSSNLLISSDESVNSTNDRNVSCSDLDITGLDAKQAIITPADIVQQDSIVVSEQECLGSMNQKLVPEIDSTVINASNNNVSSVPGKSSGSVPSGKVSCLVNSNRNPPWAYISIAGRRPEMEDAVAAVSSFLFLPSGVIGDSIANDAQKSRESLALHFFGVYDGHGGAQAANFCRERLHHALVEELETTMNEEGSNIDDGERSWQRQWERALVGCFKKVDAEVGREPKRRDDGGDENHKECCSEPVAPETVGTTAVIAIVCSRQIIVANCGDSRAVLCRAGKAFPLSVDHKPNRDDEMSRIEAAGGKVIWWNGYRVLGVLAMSRAIGDRYLKPCIIPDPEVTFTQRAREDDCLILASDGLWDVITNDEACDLARRCIVRWHNNNTNSSSNPTDGSMDPAALAAANYLCKLAIQRGSSDNITVLVVDLKAKRRRAPKN